MSKFIKTQYDGPTKEVLKYAEFEAIAVTVDDTGIVANAAGKKIVPAGTIVGGGFIKDKALNAVKANTAGAEGVLLHDVDVTYGEAPGTAVVKGYINLANIPEAPTAEAEAALKQIVFTN